MDCLYLFLEGIGICLWTLVNGLIFLPFACGLFTFTLDLLSSFDPLTNQNERMVNEESQTQSQENPEANVFLDPGQAEGRHETDSKTQKNSDRLRRSNDEDNRLSDPSTWEDDVIFSEHDNQMSTTKVEPKTAKNKNETGKRKGKKKRRKLKSKRGEENDPKVNENVKTTTSKCRYKKTDDDIEHFKNQNKLYSEEMQKRKADNSDGKKTIDDAKILDYLLSASSKLESCCTKEEKPTSQKFYIKELNEKLEANLTKNLAKKGHKSQNASLFVSTRGLHKNDLDYLQLGHSPESSHSSSNTSFEMTKKISAGNFYGCNDPTSLFKRRTSKEESDWKEVVRKPRKTPPESLFKSISNETMLTSDSTSHFNEKYENQDNSLPEKMTIPTQKPVSTLNTKYKWHQSFSAVVSGSNLQNESPLNLFANRDIEWPTLKASPRPRTEGLPNSSLLGKSFTDSTFPSSNDLKSGLNDTSVFQNGTPNSSVRKRCNPPPGFQNLCKTPPKYLPSQQQFYTESSSSNIRSSNKPVDYHFAKCQEKTFPSYTPPPPARSSRHLKHSNDPFASWNPDVLSTSSQVLSPQDINFILSKPWFQNSSTEGNIFSTTSREISEMLAVGPDDRFAFHPHAREPATSMGNYEAGSKECCSRPIGSERYGVYLQSPFTEASNRNCNLNPEGSDQLPETCSKWLTSLDEASYSNALNGVSWCGDSKRD